MGKLLTMFEKRRSTKLGNALETGILFIFMCAVVYYFLIEITNEVMK